MASTHQPRYGATWTLSTAIRKASTSMSNRAPNALEVSVRRATYPSTASRTSATVLIATMSATCGSPTRPATVSTATTPARTARVSVTRFAGPN